MRIKFFFILLFFVLFSLPVIAQEEPPTYIQDLEPVKLTPNKSNGMLFKNVSGFIDLNGYWDTRNSTIFTVNSLVNLPFMLEYFQFTNLFTDFGRGDDFRFSDVYSEQNLRFKPSKIPIDPGVQYAIISRFDDIIRFGPRFRVHDFPVINKLFKKLNLIYELSYFPAQIDGTNGYDFQMEHFYRLQVLPSVFKDRVYISGFLDHNFQFGTGTSSNHSVLVTEHQIGIRTFKQLYIVAEYRFNEFLAATDEHGVALGLEYFLGF